MGNYTLYRSNGALEEECVYVDGKKEGIYKYYDVFGNLKNTAYFRNDQLVDNEELTQTE
jgi:antitoxin component YwqK of YwqJK toxin-antitoxin module